MQQATPQDPQDQKEQTVFTPLESLEAASASSAAPNTPTSAESSQPPFFYVQDDEIDLAASEEQDGLSSPFVLPFQPSGGISPVGQPNTGHGRASSPPIPPPPSAQGATQRRSGSLLKILLIVGVVTLTILVGGVLILAQSIGPTTQRQSTSISTAVAHQPTTRASIPHPTVPPQARTIPPPSHQSTPPPTMIPSASMLAQLGWTNAGLSNADLLEAWQTAITFVNREMSLDYRDIGTLTHHGGTLTAARFLLTPGGQVRFVNNDVRMINNVLFTTIRRTQLIQQVVDPQPALVQFQTQQIQGQVYSFAWVTVSFTLFQSKIDLATGQRMEDIERDPATGQPRVHQMAVVLMRVLPQRQGPNAPMGGTGWLVNVYALDATALPDIATAPSL